MKKNDLEKKLNLKGAGLLLYKDYGDGDVSYTICLGEQTAAKIKQKIGVIPTLGGRIDFEGDNSDAQISSAAKSLLKIIDELS